MNIRNTGFANNLETAADKARLDNAAKKLLANKDIIANILRYCTPEFQNYDINFIKTNCLQDDVMISTVPVDQDAPEGSENIACLNNEDTTITEGTVRFDILFQAAVPEGASTPGSKMKSFQFRNNNSEDVKTTTSTDTPEKVILIINLEIQQDLKPGYPLECRAIYYCCRLISKQANQAKNFNYGTIRKVYSVWICLNPKNTSSNSFVRFKLSPEDAYMEVLKKNKRGYVDESADFLNEIRGRNTYDLMEIIFIGIADVKNDSKIPIIKMLSNTFSRKKSIAARKEILENEFGIKMTEEIKQGVCEMCNLGDALERYGEEKGRAEGRAEGHAEGLAEGVRITRLKTIRAIIDNFKVSAERAMAIAGVPEEDREEYRKQLSLS